MSNIQTFSQKYAKTQLKYAWKMYVMHFPSYCLGDLGTDSTGDWKIQPVSRRVGIDGYMMLLVYSDAVVTC